MGKDLNQAIDFWIEELGHYNFFELCTRPLANGWSLGQLYMHLLENTAYFIEQAKTCTLTDENTDGEAFPAAREMFLNNSFPNQDLEGPPENASTPQPRSIEQLLKDLTNLKQEVNSVEVLMSKSVFKGKTRHPGLNYFSANEWLQFAEMHLRHHLRQKKKIDEFLNRTRTTC